MAAAAAAVVEWSNEKVLEFLELLQDIRAVNISKSLITNLKECGGSRHAKLGQTQSGEMAVQSKVLSFSPRSIELEIGHPNKAPCITDFPVNRLPVINPRIILPLVEDVMEKKDLTLPAVSEHEVQAARLLVIRRKKMKKHKRKKLAKKMRSRWHQLKQRRRIRKEKAFRAELLAMVKESDLFSAEKYVADKIAHVNHKNIPKYWKGKRLPQFIVRQLMGLDPKINYKHNEFYKA